jgi:hypothetical protein
VHGGPNAIGPDAVPAVAPPEDAVEAALAAALARASLAGEWSVVATLAGEMQARRLSRADVPRLDVERARRSR